jgi:hypothetical protein
VVPWFGEASQRSGEHTFGAVRQLDPTDLELFLDDRKKFEGIHGATTLDEIDRSEPRFIIDLARAIAKRSLRGLQRALRSLYGPVWAGMHLRSQASIGRCGN